MNKTLLRKVKWAILNEPKRLYMHGWVAIPPKDLAPRCGTAGCLAGWAAILSQRKGLEPISKAVNRCLQIEQPWADIGQAALGITMKQRKRLFLVGNWPAKLEEAFNNADNQTAKSRVAARRIEHFIKTGK